MRLRRQSVALAGASDRIAAVPVRPAGTWRPGLHTCALPVPTPAFTVSLLWHPRLQAEPAHRWLRGMVLEVCAAT